MQYDSWQAETQAVLPKSALYRTLKEKCEIDAAGSQAISLVDEATFYAFQRTKTILKNMGEFTLHDGDHLFRVLLLMERLLSPDQINALSIPELMLLILGAYFHDIGMAPDEQDVFSWKKCFDENVEFVDERDRDQYNQFKRFCAARPDRLAQIELLINRGKQSEAELAKGYLYSDYIRTTHADRAREIIQRDWSDRIKYRDTDLTVEFAAICFSHNEDPLKVLDLDHQHICGPDMFACLPLVAAILRLADLLDFDAKRTPSVLFSHLFVRHPVSIAEWNKHRAIQSWVINPNVIQFQAKCSHPAIQASIHSFCDLIDQELSACNNVFSVLNDFNSRMGRNISIKIPFKVDRSKIETKKMINGKPEFVYRQSQFNLSKTQVIDLLMGTKLYGDPEVALRELIQNSIDACMLRRAMEASWGNLYAPEINIKYYSLDDDEILEIEDNGVGMDQYIIDNYYSKVGSSFYKSVDFYDLKSRSNSNFIPTSRFGIGILSCFMVADTLIVDTRKVYEPHHSSEPINLTIEGQESIFWIKPGERKTPGTTTKLILRKQQNPWQKMSDEQFVKSVETVVPNPPFKICVESRSTVKMMDENSFKNIKAESLKDYSWDVHENIREIEIDIENSKIGLVGSAIVAILEMHGLPTAEISFTSRTIDIEGENYNLEKVMRLGNEISLSSTSITIDENGSIDASNSTTQLARSKSKISLHGIEVPATLFPDFWVPMQKNQVKLDWPIPVLLVVDICGKMDLDLNSSRTQIIKSPKWFEFEAMLATEICFGIYQKVEKEYWEKLKAILLKNTKNEFFLRALNREYA